MTDQKERSLATLQITIVGLGLMGSSLALALQKISAQLTGVDTNPEAVNQLLAQKIISYGTTAFAQGVQTADLIIFATPPLTTLSLLKSLPSIKKDGAFILDLASSKNEICQTMSALPPRFAAIGAHPLCGNEQSGWQAMTPNLYQNKLFLYCPIQTHTTSHLLNILHQLIAEIGAIPYLIDAVQHDQLLSLTSHLPHLLANLLLATTDQFSQDHQLPLTKIWQLTAGSYTSATRVAGNDPQMIYDIIQSNKTAVLQQLDLFHAQLALLQNIIESDSPQQLISWLNNNHTQYQNKQQQSHPSS